ncbi:MAG: MaoC family dehydratase [Mycobacteriaceae bacterium]
MRVFTSIGELQGAGGEHLGYSPWRQVTQQQIEAFADITGDSQWIHVDVEKAAAGPFGTTIAHGYLTLSLVSALAWEVYRVDGFQMSVNYGANKLRFPSPVAAGSRVRAGVEVVSVSTNASGYQLITRVTIEIDGGVKPACVVDVVTLLVP